jgi:hypothetical protein
MESPASCKIGNVAKEIECSVEESRVLLLRSLLA